MAIGPRAVSEQVMIIPSIDTYNEPQRGQTMARAFVSSLELIRVADSVGNRIDFYNLETTILPNTFHCAIFYIPIC